MKVLIIGAGTGGLALAHKLKAAGVNVSIFKRDLLPNANTGGYRVFATRNDHALRPAEFKYRSN